MNGWRRVLIAAFVGGALFHASLSAQLIAGEATPRSGKATPTIDSERGRIAELLDAGKQVSTKSLAAARRIHAQLVQSAAHRGRADYALALVLVRHQRYDEANEILAEIAAEQSGRLRVLAMRVRVWSLAAVGRYEDTMDEAAGLAKQFSPEPVDSERALWIETARRLGHVTGYAAGPCSEKLAPGVRQRYERRIREGLPEYALAAFEEALSATALRYSELEEEYRQAEAANKDQQSDKLATARDEIKSSGEEINTQWASLEEKSEKRGERSANEVAGIEARIAEAAVMFNRIDVQNRALKLEVLRLDQENVETMQTAANTVRDVSQAPRDQLAISRNRGTMEQLEAQIAVFETQLATLRARAILLQRQRAQVVARQESEKRRLERKQAELAQEAKVLANKSKLLERRPPGHSAKMLTLKKRMESLSTYAELHYDEERQRILASFDGEKSRR